MIIAPSHSHTNTAKLAKTIQHKVCASFAIFWFQDTYLYKTFCFSPLLEKPETLSASVPDTTQHTCLEAIVELLFTEMPCPAITQIGQ